MLWEPAAAQGAAQRAAQRPEMCFKAHTCLGSPAAAHPCPARGAAGAAIAARVLASRAFREAPHAVIYVHCAKLREVDTTAVLQQAMEARKRCARAGGARFGAGVIGRAGMDGCPRTPGGLPAPNAQASCCGASGRASSPGNRLRRPVAAAFPTRDACWGAHHPACPGLITLPMPSATFLAGCMCRGCRTRTPTCTSCTSTRWMRSRQAPTAPPPGSSGAASLAQCLTAAPAGS